MVIPHTDPPSPPFELSGLSGQNLILFFDDIHRTIRISNPLRWRKVLIEATRGRCLIICTSRDGEDWKTVRDNEIQLLDELGPDACVFTSRVGKKGEDFSEVQGWRLANGLGLKLSPSEFKNRFDGTPGSLTLNLEAMRTRYERLQDKHLGDVSMSRLLDSAKVLYVANQPRLRIDVLRRVSEQIRGAGPLSAEMWETLQRSTEAEGFGQFDREAGEFQIYRPYLEDCVLYQPPVREVEALFSILTDMKDYAGLNYLSEALLMKYNSPLAESVVRVSIVGGEKSANSVLGLVLAGQPGREAEAEQAYRNVIGVGENVTAYNNLGLLLARQPGREAEAEQIYRAAIDAGVRSAYVNLGNLLAGQPGREAEAEQAYRSALKAGLGALAYYNLGLLLDKQPERAGEAKQLYRIAIEAGYKDTYLKPDTLSAERQIQENEARRVFQTTTNTQEKSEYYYSFDNQTFKTPIDVLVPANEPLHDAYRLLIDELGTQNLQDID